MEPIDHANNIGASAEGTRLLLYGYATGESSSRRMEQATYDNVAFRYLAADQHPDHDTIASFRAAFGKSGPPFCSGVALVPKGGISEVGARGH